MICRVVVLCLAALSVCSAAATAAAKSGPTASASIVGGSLAAEGSLPYVGALVVRGGPPSADARREICGATLVRPDVAITAAHCMLSQRGGPVPFLDPSRLQVVFGKRALGSPAAGDRAIVAQMTIPVGFSTLGLGPGDLAVLHLAGPVPETPALLYPASASTTSLTGATGRFAGWGVRRPLGFVASNLLREGGGTIAPQESCRLPRVLRATLAFLCLSGRSRGAVCHGDSGGPLLSGDYLVGVTNYTFSRCAARGGREEWASVIPSSPNYPFVAQAVANRDRTSPTVTIDAPIPDPVPPSRFRRYRLGFRSSEPVRAVCTRGRRAVECGAGSTGSVSITPGRRRGPVLIKIFAFDESFNGAVLDYSFTVGP